MSAIEVMDVSATRTLMHRCWRRRVGIRWRMAGCTSTTTHARPQTAAIARNFPPEEEVEALALYGTSKEVMDVSATWTLMRRCWRRRVGIRWKMAGCTSTTTHARPQIAQAVRANLLSRAHFQLWSFCHEQLGHYTSGAPCGLCNVRCVYGLQSCPRCMPADGDKLAPGGPLSRVQASDGLRHRRDAAKAIGARDAFEELGVPDEFEHSIGAEVVLEINGKRPVVGRVVRQILNWGHFEDPHGLRLSRRVHRWRLP